MSSFLPVLVVAASVGGTIDISDRVEARARDTYDASGVVIDAETAPEIKITLRPRPWELLADYAPRFTLRQINAGAQPDVLQQGRLVATWHDRRGKVSLYENAGYGRQTTAAIASAPSAAGATQLDSLPEALVIEYVSCQSGLTATWAASRRWGMNALLEVALTGGAGARSEAVIPFETALHGVVGAEYAASRRDRIGPTLDATRAVFSSGWEDGLLLTKVFWRHALARNTTTLLAGGVGGFVSAKAAEPTGGSLDPIVEAGITHRADNGLLDVGMLARISPVIDRVTGRVDERVEATANLGWNLTRALGIQVSVGAAQSIPSDEAGAITLLYDTATASYRLTRNLQLYGGVWSGWMKTRGADTAPLQWTVSTGATFTAPAISL